ncbi:MAG: sigma 54-interacting transcriptional regulator, partial [Terriglobia bacterium]
FVTLNCAAVPAELIESELFGHEKGAFTGAGARHTGKFEQAQRGTLFLDEIGDMPLPMQAKLLRVLEEGEIERVGGDRPIAVDVRIVVATHRNLEELITQGKFREDLYHRVYVFPLVLPPLRDRPEDIPVLVDHFARQVAAQNGWKPTAFDAAAIDALKRYTWRGNVRELHNMVERLLLLATGDSVDVATVLAALPRQPAAIQSGVGLPAAGTLAQRVDLFERETIVAELRGHQNHITQTARALGLERSYLYKKCQQLGIDLRAMRKEE